MTLEVMIILPPCLYWKVTYLTFPLVVKQVKPFPLVVQVIVFAWGTEHPVWLEMALLLL